MKTLLSLTLCLCLLLLPVPARADPLPEPSASCVRISSHGGSGTCIATGEGWTLILSCAHMFEGGDRNKPVKIQMRHPTPGAHKAVGISVLAVGNTSVNDVSLLRMNFGPVPYVSQVAPIGYQSDPDCWSCGFDALKFPVHCRPARITGTRGNTTTTDARPNHGRSGGCLIEKKTGYLVGVVSAYSGPGRRGDNDSGEFVPGANGIYCSLPAIHRFLAQAGVMQGAGPDLGTPSPFVQPSPPPLQRQFAPQGRAPFQQQYGPPSCPDGNCPQRR